MNNLSEEFVQDIIEVIKRHDVNIIDFNNNMNAIRDRVVKEEYFSLYDGTKGNGMKVRQLLSEKYCTSPENIENILYRKTK